MSAHLVANTKENPNNDAMLPYSPDPFPSASKLSESCADPAEALNPKKSASKAIESETAVANKALSVSELTQRIKSQLEMAYPSVAVQGELSNFKRQSSGHLYFSLKDEGAQIQVALFANFAQKLGFDPKDGDQVIVRGQLTVYNSRGQYQIVGRSIEKVGMGEILLRLEALKKELKALGWFDASRKKPLPALPDRIGVVSSPTGAVIRDIIHVLRMRHPGFQLILYPAKVQGIGSSAEIAAGIRFLNKHKLCDVIIIARGGGSFEDLMPFNERPLLEAVYESQLPIISAVGHETDFTLCDFIADYRAPTPSAAAEKVILPKGQLQDKLGYLFAHIERHIETQLLQNRAILRSAKRSRWMVEPNYLLLQSQQRLDEWRYRLEQQLKQQLTKQRTKLAELSQSASPFMLYTWHERARQRLNQTWSKLEFKLAELDHQTRRKLELFLKQAEQLVDRRLQQPKLDLQRLSLQLTPSVLLNLFKSRQRQLINYQEVLAALSPTSALKRGYTIVRTLEGKPLQRADQLIVGQAIQLQMQSATVSCLVQQIEIDPEKAK